MAKHPVPKRRSTSTRSALRHSNWFSRTLKKIINRSSSVSCPQCNQTRLPHTACATCGQYRNRTVIDKNKKIKKIEKIKA